MYSIYINLQCKDGRSHSLIVVLHAKSVELAVAHAVAVALAQVDNTPKGRWTVDDYVVADQTIIDLNTDNQ